MTSVHMTSASRTSSRNVHAKIQISDLNSVHSSLVIYNTNYKRQTNQQLVQPETSYARCLFQRAEIQENKYKCAKLSTQRVSFPPGSILRFIHQPQQRKYLRHGINITTNQRLSPTFRGNGNTIIVGDSPFFLVCLRLPVNIFFYLHSIYFSIYSLCKQFISKFLTPLTPRLKTNGASLRNAV